MQMPLRALIIEDSEDDTLLIVHRLERAGYKLTYERLETKDAMRDALDREKWDIIISDYKMPGFSGLAALKLYKEKGLEIPFIIVSGTIGEEVAAEAIISGAHDYVMKNNLSRLIPSIQRELKNAGSRRERRQAEEALKKSEDNYRAIYENATEGIFQTTPEGQFISVNPALARMIGYYTPEELMKGVTDLSKQGYVNPEDRVRYKEILEGQGTIYGFETQHYRKDGSIIWVSINARAVKDEAGKILYYEGTAQDVTQRKQAEEKLRHEKQRLSILTENAPFGMAMIDKDGNFAYINPKFKEIFGYDLSDIPDGRTWFTKAYPDQVHRHTVISAWLEDLRRAGPGEKRPHVFSATCKDGTEKIINFISVQMETGVHIMTCEDITLQKKSEEALLSSRKQLSDIIEFLPDATFVIDKDKKVIAWNRALEQLTGVKKEDILGKGDQAYSIPFYGGKRPILIDLVFEDDPEKHQKYKMIEKKGDIIYGEGYAPAVYGGKGAYFWGTASPLLDSDANIVGAIESVRDITAQKKSEEMLLRSKENYRSITDNALNGIYRKTEDGKFLMANPAFLGMLGYTSLEEMAISINDITHQLYVNSEDRECIKRLLEKEDTIRRFETQFYKKDRSKIWVSINMRTVRDADKNILYYEGIDEDITSRKQAEEDLKQTMEKLRKSLAGTIQAMSLTVETRDPYTAGHQRKVSNLARTIAQEMGLSNDAVDIIRMAGIIHDIGKISVPAEILSKPGKLSDTEFSLIKVHSQTGYDILKDVELPYPIAEIVLQHHERLNGSGYPKGLKGEQILLEARIISVADVVEAIASYRPYRPGLGIDVALEEIEKNKGILFDERVVEACLKLFREKEFKLETTES